MVLRIASAFLLTACVAVALPAVAGDYRGRPDFQRRHFFERPHWVTAGSYRPDLIARQDRRLALGFGFDRRRDRFLYGAPYLYRAPYLYGAPYGVSGSANIASNSLTIVVGDTPMSGVDGTYAGTSYAYGGDGGTYVVSGGYGGYPVRRQVRLAPRAKIIDVARRPSAGCSYEAGVCVIRP
ncbi:hypothetical protein [Rhizobium sp. BK251]|uniref:hypothetical protein n=1 Tax=Rhizobium sp. BK251 TaxID=2512125 RepID=UPI00104CE511|nr:hypothetical protein [Rhizobium sp. BK251]TCL72766.1 hypothetical protein EV286_104190 [Rhizobium sp. BK251]